MATSPVWTGIEGGDAGLPSPRGGSSHVARTSCSFRWTLPNNARDETHLRPPKRSSKCYGQALVRASDFAHRDALFYTMGSNCIACSFAATAASNCGLVHSREREGRGASFGRDVFPSSLVPARGRRLAKPGETYVRARPRQSPLAAAFHVPRSDPIAPTNSRWCGERVRISPQGRSAIESARSSSIGNVIVHTIIAIAYCDCLHESKISVSSGVTVSGPPQYDVRGIPVGLAGPRNRSNFPSSSISPSVGDRIVAEHGGVSSFVPRRLDVLFGRTTPRPSPEREPRGEPARRRFCAPRLFCDLRSPFGSSRRGTPVALAVSTPSGWRRRTPRSGAWAARRGSPAFGGATPTCRRCSGRASRSGRTRRGSGPASSGRAAAHERAVGRPPMDRTAPSSTSVSTARRASARGVLPSSDAPAGQASTGLCASSRRGSG